MQLAHCHHCPLVHCALVHCAPSSLSPGSLCPGSLSPGSLCPWFTVPWFRHLADCMQYTAALCPYLPSTAFPPVTGFHCHCDQDLTCSPALFNT
ncbi:hypothetical protein ACOMHN_030607 [Nucella lapillus]